MFHKLKGGILGPNGKEAGLQQAGKANVGYIILAAVVPWDHITHRPHPTKATRYLSSRQQ